jgi:hypothetical protein
VESNFGEGKSPIVQRAATKGDQLRRGEFEAIGLSSMAFGEETFCLSSSRVAPFIRQVRKAIRASGLRLNDM